MALMTRTHPHGLGHITEEKYLKKKKNFLCIQNVRVRVGIYILHITVFIIFKIFSMEHPNPFDLFDCFRSCQHQHGIHFDIHMITFWYGNMCLQSTMYKYIQDNGITKIYLNMNQRISLSLFTYAHTTTTIC